MKSGRNEFITVIGNTLEAIEKSIKGAERLGYRKSESIAENKSAIYQDRFSVRMILQEEENIFSTASKYNKGGSE